MAAANVAVAFCEQGLHWTLTGDPVRYQLFEDLGRRGRSPPGP